MRGLDSIFSITTGDSVKDRLARWKIMITMWKMNNCCTYQDQRSLLYEDVAHESDKNPRTTRAIMYRLVKQGKLEISKLPRPYDSFGDGLSGIGHTRIRKDGNISKLVGRKRSSFKLSRKVIAVLSKNMYEDRNGEIQIKIPITTLTNAEVLTIVYRMRNKRRAHV